MSFDDSDDPPLFHPKNRYDLNSKIMLIAIISLSAVVLLVTALHVYARCYLRRQARRRAAALQNMMIAATTRAANREPKNTGLDPAVIASLPVTVFAKNGYDSDDDSETVECAVCLSGLKDGDVARTLPNCSHTFHAECIDRWFGSHSTCPVCRAEAKPINVRHIIVPENREPAVRLTCPSAPPVEPVGSGGEAGDTSASVATSAKVGGPGSSSSFRLSSFRKILSRERSSRRIVQSCGGEDYGIQQDLERQ